MAAERWCSFSIAGDSLWLQHRIDIEFGAWRLRLLPATAMRQAALQIEIAAPHLSAAEARAIAVRFLCLLGGRVGSDFVLAPRPSNRVRRGSSARGRRGP
jgi:hypothetical protein